MQTRMEVCHEMQHYLKTIFSPNFILVVYIVNVAAFFLFLFFIYTSTHEGVLKSSWLNLLHENLISMFKYQNGDFCQVGQPLNFSSSPCVCVWEHSHVVRTFAFWLWDICLILVNLSGKGHLDGSGMVIPACSTFQKCLKKPYHLLTQVLWEKFGRQNAWGCR